MSALPDASVQCCVTSPPYWGLRDYGVSGQMGLERTPEEYVQGMVRVFEQVRRVLREDGTLWLNLGDSYANLTTGGNGATGGRDKSTLAAPMSPIGTTVVRSKMAPGYKQKDLVGIPWMVAFALRSAGWYLRSDIIWAKPNPMPESVTDRPTKSHEYLFLLSKAGRYYYDSAAIAEPFADASLERLRQDVASQKGSNRVPGKTNGPMKAVGLNVNRSSYRPGSASSMNDGEHVAKSDSGLPLREVGRNSRSVWFIGTQSYAQAHFATFPEELARRCILAGSKPGDTVLDPFGGSGTVAQVATGNGRGSIYIDLNPAYLELAKQRIGPMLCEDVA
jgi:DNA modification methylase